MNHSPSIALIALQLVAAQKKIGAATKTAENPFFKSSYASLGDVMKACKEELLEQGITVLQPLGHDEHGDYVETILLHESGEFISDKARMHMTKQNDPQAYGSATTYVRRYALQSMCFIPSEDDDANGAIPKRPSPPNRPVQQERNATVRHNQGEPDEIRRQAPGVIDPNDEIEF